MSNTAQIYIKQKEQILLPAPKWEEYGMSFKNVMTWETVEWPIVFARLPLIDQELIDSGNVYLEYGRLRGLSKSKKRIVFWADSTWLYNGTTTWWWIHSNTSVTRPNRIPVTQSRDLMFELPREQFYRTRQTKYFDELSANWLSTYDELVCSWSTRRPILEPNTFSEKPRLQNFKDEYQTVQARYARLIVIENWNVIAQWDISEPYYTETEKQFTIQIDKMSIAEWWTRWRRINWRIGESHKH